MDGTLTLVNLAGFVALLLWGVRMVQTGIQRAFGADLHRLLRAALGNRLSGFASGLAVTAILQSSTATGLMVASFAAAGLVDLVPALAAMLGANVGTTLIVQLLSFDMAAVAPVLILIGVLMFRRAQATRLRDLGRVAIGLGLMLIALQQLLWLITPFEDVPSLRLLLGAVSTAPVLDVILAAGLTWAAHSSVAMVLLVVSFAAKGVVPPEAAFALVLGANLGTAINPVLEGPGGADPAARRLPLGNLLNRIAGCFAALALMPLIAPALLTMQPEPGRAVALFHTGFNLVLAAVFLPLLGPFAALLRHLLPPRAEAADPTRPLHLDESALESPPIALAGAAREALRMADVLEAMLAAAAEALTGGDRTRVAETRRMDDVLDRLNSAIGGYLARFDAEALSEADHRRVTEILIFATNMESAGDVVDRNLMGHVTRRLKRGLALSAAEVAQTRALMLRLAGTLQAAATVFMTGDSRAAGRLAAERESFRDLEAAAMIAQLGVPRAAGRIDAAAVVHVDILRDLRRVNAHLAAAASPDAALEVPRGAISPAEDWTD